MTSTACDDQFAPETELFPTAAVCARTHTSDQVLTGNYFQLDSERLEEECRLARERGKTVCVWTKSDDDNIYYQSSCGGDYEAYENVPTFDRFDFCPFCGKPIKVKQ